MISSVEIERLAFELSESERAVLATRLLDSLPAYLEDDDEGITEALRRDAELDADPKIGISLEQLDREVDDLRA